MARTNVFFLLLLVVGVLNLPDSLNVGHVLRPEHFLTMHVTDHQGCKDANTKTDGKEVSVEGEIVTWGQGKSLYEEMKNEIDENEKSMQEMVTGDYVLPNSGTVRLQESDLASF